MAEQNPYCRPALMGRGSPFYGASPRKESLYDRGNLGPPIYGEYRDRWTGKEWLRGDGSKAPLAGFGFTAAELQNTGRGTGVKAAFVAREAAPTANLPCPPGFARAANGACLPLVPEEGARDNRLIGTCGPGFYRVVDAGGAPICLPLSTAGGALLTAQSFWKQHQTMLMVGGAVAAVGIGYLLLKRK